MFFLLSKLFWLVFVPSHLIVWLVLAAALLLWRNRPHQARWPAIAAAALLILFGVLPTGAWLTQRLENTDTRPAYPDRVDGVLILGGGNDPIILKSRGVMAPDRALSRLVAAYELSRRYPEARIVFSGGSGEITDQSISESTAAQRILFEIGLSESRLTLEGKSRNSWENFVFTKGIVKPKAGEIWLLATSAFHMPRAMAISRRVGWTMVPWPTDYMTGRRLRYSLQNVPQNLERTDTAIHEYIGLLTYRLSGKSA